MDTDGELRMCILRSPPPIPGWAYASRQPLKSHALRASWFPLTVQVSRHPNHPWFSISEFRTKIPVAWQPAEKKGAASPYASKRATKSRLRIMNDSSPKAASLEEHRKVFGWLRVFIGLLVLLVVLYPFLPMTRATTTSVVSARRRSRHPISIAWQRRAGGSPASWCLARFAPRCGLAC